MIFNMEIEFAGILFNILIRDNCFSELHPTKLMKLMIKKLMGSIKSVRNMINITSGLLDSHASCKLN